MLRRALQQAHSLLVPPVCHTLQTRNTVVVRRMYPTRLFKKGYTPKLKRIKSKIYITEDDSNTPPSKDMDVLLMKDVKGVGRRGEVVNLPKRIARNRLLPLGIAVYPSPENIEKYSVTETKSDDMSDTTSRTIRQLERMTLPIPMSPDIDWELNTNHVRLAFRKVGVMLSVDTISLPDEVITGPCDISLTVTINKEHKVPVKATVFHFIKSDPRSSELPDVWKKSKQSMEEALKALELKS